MTAFAKQTAVMENRLDKLFVLTLEDKTLSADMTLGQAIAAMSKTGGHCFLVQAEGRKPVGVLSEHDVVSALARYGDAAAKVKISEIMTIDIYAAHEGSTLDDALKIMADHNIRHLPVMSDDGKILGFLSIMDIVMKKQKILPR